MLTRGASTCMSSWVKFRLALIVVLTIWYCNWPSITPGVISLGRLGSVLSSSKLLVQEANRLRINRQLMEMRLNMGSVG